MACPFHDQPPKEPVLQTGDIQADVYAAHPAPKVPGFAPPATTAVAQCTTSWRYLHCATACSAPRRA